jgi:hypothetical protein
MTAYPDSEFIDLILKLIEDGDLRKRIGTNAQRNVGLFYEWEETAKKAAHSYNKLVCVSGKKRRKIDQTSVEATLFERHLSILSRNHS